MCKRLDKLLVWLVRILCAHNTCNSLTNSCHNKHTEGLRGLPLTGAVAHAAVLDNVVTVQNAEGVDLLGEVLQGRVVFRLELLHSQHLARVVPQGVVAAQLHAAKVPLGARTRGILKTPGHSKPNPLCASIW